MIHFPLLPLTGWDGPFFSKGAPVAPPAVRGTASTAAMGTATVTLPTFSVGDQLVVLIAWGSGGTAPSTPAGWTAQTPIAAAANVTLSPFVKTAAGGDTFVCSSTPTTAVYSAYAVQNAPLGFDASASTTGTTGSPINSGSATLTGSNDVWINAYVAFGNVSAATISTPSAGTATAQVTNTLVSIRTAWQQLTSTSGPANTAAVSTNADIIGYSVGIH